MNHNHESFSHTLWLNGSFISIRQAHISPLDRGFLYGDGLFETLRAEKGLLLYLREHLDRLYDSAAHLSIEIPHSINWKDILDELLKKNNLLAGPAKVKLMVTRGVCSALGMPHQNNPFVVMIADRYVPPAPTSYRKGWRLHTVQQGFSPPLSCYKSLNYLYFLQARQLALDAGADEAVVLDPQGNVSETAAGSLLIQIHGQWWIPKSSFQLPGITIQQVARMLRERDLFVESRALLPEEVYSSQTVWVLNSLMGIMPVHTIDGVSIPETRAQDAGQLREKLFSSGR